MHSQRAIVIITAALTGNLVGCKPQTDESSSAASGKADTAKTCAHVVEVLGKTVTDAAALEKAKIDCEASLTEVETRHASLTACMLASTSNEEIAACEKPAYDYRSVVGAAVASNEQVCQHVMDVLKAEIGDTANVSEEELRVQIGKCAKDLDKERQKIGDEEYAKRVKCVLAAQKMDDMMKCDSDR